MSVTKVSRNAAFWYGAIPVLIALFLGGFYLKSKCDNCVDEPQPPIEQPENIYLSISSERLLNVLNNGTGLENLQDQTLEFFDHLIPHIDFNEDQIVDADVGCECGTNMCPWGTSIGIAGYEVPGIQVNNPNNLPIVITQDALETKTNIVIRTTLTLRGTVKEESYFSVKYEGVSGELKFHVKGTHIRIPIKINPGQSY